VFPKKVQVNNEEYSSKSELNGCSRRSDQQKAVDFYSKYGFEQLPDSEKMFLPMKIIEQLI